MRRNDAASTFFGSYCDRSNNRPSPTRQANRGAHKGPRRFAGEETNAATVHVFDQKGKQSLDFLENSSCAEVRASREDEVRPSIDQTDPKRARRFAIVAIVVVLALVIAMVVVAFVAIETHQVRLR